MTNDLKKDICRKRKRGNMSVPLKPKFSFLHLIVIVAFITFFIIPAHAQVITASLDPTQPVIMPAAAAWREAMVLGGSYLEQTGTRTLNDQQIYQFEGSGFSANAVFQISNFFIDGYASQIKTDAQIEQYYAGGGIINLARSDNRLNIALTGNDFVTIGLGARMVDSTDYFDATFDSATNSQMRAIGSISIKAMDVFYFGVGYERVRESSDYAVDLNWNNLVGGIGVKLGQPGSTRLRAEYSFAFSPSAENEVQGDLRPSKHNETTTHRLGAELMFSGLLFALNGKQTNIDLSDVSAPPGTVFPDEMSKSRTSGGVLWIPDEGLMLGFYFANETTTYGFKDSRSEFRINLGYLF